MAAPSTAPGGEEQFRLLVENVSDYAIVGLDVAGRVNMWNVGAERIKGYRAEEIIGRHFSVFFSAEDVAAGKPQRELEIAARDGRHEEQGWRVRNDGSRFWANVVVTAFYDGDHRVRGFGKITRDITQRHEQSERLAQATQELTEANEALRRQAEELSRARDVATAAVRRQEFGRQLANALEMADDEPEVLEVIERSLSSVLPGSPVELLLADNSHAHLVRTAMASPTGAPPGCKVDSPEHCPAARRAQVQRFDDSESLDACPKLRNRPEGPVAALCVPVSIMGRTVGVFHATGLPQTEFAEEEMSDLRTLANLSGARIGLLRVLAEVQLQAATDSLTGLLNRRAFEQRVTTARLDLTELSLAMADLDQFKALNDTYGHETGDRALRLFSQVLATSVRSQDLVCRYGGEEFVIAFADCPAEKATGMLVGLRDRLRAAIAVAGLPPFTVSFGVVESGPHEDLPAVIGRADTALFQAKREGRDRVVVLGAAGALVARTQGAASLQPPDRP